MSTPGEIVQTGGGNTFINHVFNFDNETKHSLMNITQYICLAIIPCSIVNHFIDNIIPEPDESKGNIEITAEVLGHFVMVFITILFVHRLVTYVPTYSGRTYDSLNLINLILAVIIIAYESNNKAGAKVKILLERVQELWEGKPKKQETKGNGNASPNVVVSQPISSLQQPIPTHQSSRADYVQVNNAMQQPVQQQQQQETMQGGMGGMNTPLFNEPMAANGALGGSFGSAF
tara:strand:+ start:7415 stop:8110 length:696 start_codon:yes stop_codon:yes gene_type:complete